MGWTAGRNVSQMLNHLWIKGQLMVAGRKGGQKLWDLAERCLPDWTPRDPLPEREIVRRAVQKSLRALGLARPGHIQQHYIRGRYPGLAEVMADLEREGCRASQIAEDGQTVGPGTFMQATRRCSTGGGGQWSPRATPVAV
jgi:uncharacterized protein YcaQ